MLGRLLNLSAYFGAKVIIDTSFSGVEFNSKGFDGWNLRATMDKLSSNRPGFCAFLLGGLFSTMRTSRIEFGFLAINEPSFVDAFHSFGGLSKPHSTIKYAVRKLLVLREQRTGDLLNAIAEHTEILETRFKRLKQTLESCGWQVLDAQAGVSIVAKPFAYLGKTVTICKDSGILKIKLDDSNIREAMLRGTGLCINSASWTGIPGYCRFTIGLDDSSFNRALDCITKFRNLVCN